ncbi:MAG: archaea-specific SMC-related protein [Halodesulfurarchaeum sp.]
MTWTIEAENIAGIRTGSATIQEGVNALRAENWQGKSSLLAAIKTALGVDSPLMEGADRGSVVLTDHEGEQYRVELRRENGSVVRDGTPVLETEYDRICADLFAALDETNEVRHAVRDSENLQAVLTYPLDFENIDRKIEDRKRERDTVEGRLARAEAAAESIPAMESTVRELESELAELEERRDRFGSQDDAGSLDERREKLSDLRAEREGVRDRIERLERAVERTRETLEEKRGELAELELTDEEDLGRELESVREQYERVERDRKLLQQVYSANKRLVDEDRVDLLASVERGLIEDSVTCWVCGNDAEVTHIEDRLEAIRETLSELRSQEAEYSARLEELETKQAKRRAERKQKHELESEIPRLENTLSDRTESLETSREALEALNERIEALGSSVSDIDETRTDLESEIKYKMSELEDAKETLADLESQAEDVAALREKHETQTDEIRELRSRKDTVKQRTRDAFEGAMNNILDRFDTGFESARLTGGFDLLVARQGREVSLDALSQGELEILGIVAALAGHDAYDVEDTTPVLLLDDLGRLSDANVGHLVSYLSDRADYLVFTSYPEHSAFDGTEIELENWSVVSDGTDAVSTV